MMNNNFFSHELLKQQLMEVINGLKNIANPVVPFNRENILFDEDLQKILRVSSRTLRNYRKRGYLRGIRLEGKWMYLKTLLYIDFLNLYFKQWDEENERESNGTQL